MKTRLDRWLVLLDRGSRKQVQALIRSGAVRVDGRVIRDPGEAAETETAQLTVMGEAVDGRVVRHVLMDKPAGLLTAARDPKQPTVMDLLPGVYSGTGCMPVGRLDKDTTGLLLLTTDGEMNHRLLSPGRHVEKRYRALAEGIMDREDIELFARGIRLSDFEAQPARLEILKTTGDTTLAEVVITEGRYHQVKRMFAAAGHEVLQLHRRCFGPLELDPALPEGAWRELTADEVGALRQAAGMERV